MPKYPIYPSQPLTGNLPSMVQMGPSDLLPTSGTAPGYLRRLMTGRHLAGLGSDEEQGVPQLPAASPKSDDNDFLRTLEKDDDAEGNGIFDNARRRPINYPDAGIFASHWAIPGYIARSKSFAKSEVRDITTGGSVVYVPGGAVSVDDAAKIAYLEGQAYNPLRRILMDPAAPPSVDTTNVAVSTKPVTGTAIETVPTAAVAAANAAATEISKGGGVALMDPSLVASLQPTTKPVAPAAPQAIGMNRVVVGALALLLGFGVGWVVNRKDQP